MDVVLYGRGEKSDVQPARDMQVQGGDISGHFRRARPHSSTHCAQPSRRKITHETDYRPHDLWAARERNSIRPIMILTSIPPRPMSMRCGGPVVSPFCCRPEGMTYRPCLQIVAGVLVIGGSDIHPDNYRWQRPTSQPDDAGPGAR